MVALSSAEAELGAADSEGESRSARGRDVGETTRGHVMGDASAAIGIIRRMGLGKVRHMNTSWLWVQEKDASRELQYHKAKCSDNSADLFTKALDYDSIKRHTESFASTVNDLSATLSMKKSNGHGETVRDKKKNGRVDKNGHAQQDLQDHKQGRTGLEM